MYAHFSFMSGDDVIEADMMNIRVGDEASFTVAEVSELDDGDISVVLQFEEFH